MRNSIGRILLVTAVLGLAACLGTMHPAAAADRNFTLYGDNTNGWGFSAGNQSNPGPALSVTVGDNVTLVLHSTDGSNYRWFLDYNNDSSRQGNEPRSPGFGTTAVTWNFTADTVGTFHYRAQSDPAAMWGMFTVSNVTTQPPPGGNPLQLDTSLIIVLGVVLGFVAVLVIVGAVVRKKQQAKQEKKA